MSNALKTGLLLVLSFLHSPILYSQVYFNKLYNESLGGYPVTVADSSYFLTTRIIKNGNVGLVTLTTGLNGQLQNADTTFLLDAALYSGYTGSIVSLYEKSYFLCIIRKSPTNSYAGLYKSDLPGGKEITRLKYQDSVSTVPYGISKDLNNNLIYAGYAFKYTGGQQLYQRQLLLMQLDTVGNKLWERSYTAKAGLWHLQGNSVIATQDGGYAVGGGGAYAQIGNLTYAYLLVVDSLGNKIIDRYFMNDAYGNFVIHVQQKPNGNFLIAYSKGYFSKDPQNWRERAYYISVAELDKNNLATIWEKDYLPGYINLRSVGRLIPQNDSTYLIAGTYRPDYILYEGDYASQLGYIFAINQDGDSLWYRDYSNQTDSFELNYLNDIAVTPDGGIVGAGRLETPNSPYTGGLANHVWLFKTDSIGCLYAGCDTVYEKKPQPITEFKVYPNPAQAGQSLTIEVPNATTATARLINTVGQVVLQQELKFVDGMAHLPLMEGAGGRTGVYLLHLQTPNGKTYVEKIVFY